MVDTLLSGLGAASGFLTGSVRQLGGFLGQNAGSIIGGLGQLASGAVSTPLQLYGTRKQIKYARKQNELYNKWLIPFQNEENLKFQDAYLRNSPSATVAGLRSAGLNPILAASGGFSTGTPSSASAGTSVSGSSSAPNTRVDLMQLQNMQKQNEVLQSQKEELQSRSFSNIFNAETTRMKAEADIRNQTMETDYNVKSKDVETALRTLEVDRRTKGNNYDSSQLRDASQVLSHALDAATYGWDYLNNRPSSKTYKDITSHNHRPNISIPNLSPGFRREVLSNMFDTAFQGVFPLLFQGLRKVSKHRFAPLHIR